MIIVTTTTTTPPSVQPYPSIHPSTHPPTQGLLSELGFSYAAETELGPYTLDMLVQPAASPSSSGGTADEKERPVVIEVDGATHFFANGEAAAEAEGGQKGKAPRGQTALKRRCVMGWSGMGWGRVSVFVSG
jgi:hypothetical protein